MKNLCLLVLCLYSFVALSKCDETSGQTLSDAANCFNVNFYKQLRSDNSNVASSPFSAYVVISMLRAGAGGNTLKQMTNALGDKGISVSDMEDGFQSLLSKLTSSNGNTLDVNNTIWIQKSFTIQQDFKDAILNKFLSQPHSVDFNGDPVEATKEINDWANSSTQGMIPKIFDQTLDPTTVMVLANAMFFNGTWQNTFTTDDTSTGDFYNNDSNNPSKVQLMHQTKTFNYKTDQNLKAQVLEMDYVGGDMSMVIFLPMKGNNLQSLIQGLTCDTFKSGLQSLGSTKVDVTIPKFEISSNFDLTKPMNKIGITDAFQSNANLSGISPNLQVSEVKQKCVVKVNEKGTQAAVVTALAIFANSIERPIEQPEVFNANHPFLYVIQDKRTGLILFIGEVNQLSS